MSALPGPSSVTPSQEPVELTHVQLPLRSTVVKDEPDFDVSFGEALRSIFTDGLNPGFKKLFYATFGTGHVVQEMGFSLSDLSALRENERADLIQTILERRGQEEGWREKLENAVLLTALSRQKETVVGDQSVKEHNSAAIKFLRQQAQPGDIIFVASNGPGQTVTGEIFENAVRSISAYDQADKKFPFVHVMVVRADGRLFDLTMLGRKYRSWEDVFIKLGRYNAVALTRLDEPKENRDAFANSAFNFLKGKIYNYLWLGLCAPWLVLNRSERPLIGGSVTKGSGVCVDVVTEGARRLKRKCGVDLGESVMNAETALDLFKSSKIQVVEALTLKHN